MNLHTWHVPHYIISMKTMPPSGRAHPQLHCVKIWSGSKVVPEIQPCSCSCSHTASMSTWSTSPDTPPMAYQVQVHVPLPMYNWAASNQMQDFCLFNCQLETWTQLCKIKAEEKLDYLLCILGKQGYAAMDRWVPADEAHKNNPVKFLRLHRKHIRRWDLPTSWCLWAGRHHKEVWQIHRWASRLDMPTCPQGTNWQWQWHCDQVRSSTQADSGNPRHWHWAVQTTSEGQPWQEGIASTRDLQNILCCWIRCGCNVCRSCSTCCMPHLPDTWSKDADVICTVPPLHPSTPSQ